MSISVKEVSKLYGPQKALDNVSFSLNKGEVVGFLGPNGAGKSTMMKIITCYIPQSAGRVEVCGHDVLEASIAVRQKVGYLPEHNPLYLDMYVREYLAFVAGIHKLRNKDARVREMIGMVGLSPEQHKKIGQLSKGYRQRVGLAQAMIHNPEVLILDEPTSGLDPNQLADIRNLIKTIGREKTVMLSTHIMQEVEAICSRAIIINKGRIAADRSTADLRSAGQDSTPVLLVEFGTAQEARTLQSIPGLSRALPLGDNRWELYGLPATDIRKELMTWAAASGADILAMSRKETSLEDVFKELTKAGTEEA